MNSCGSSLWQIRLHVLDAKRLARRQTWTLAFVFFLLLSFRYPAVLLVKGELDQWMDFVCKVRLWAQNSLG